MHCLLLNLSLSTTPSRGQEGFNVSLVSWVALCLSYLEAGLRAASGAAFYQWPPAAAAAASCHLPSLQCPEGAYVPITMRLVSYEQRIPVSK